MKRVTISLPDSLLERMRKHKDEINFSLVAREAIEEEIKRLEIWDDPAKELAKTIEKFRKEKEEIMEEWRKEGFKSGQDYVKSSSFSDVERYVEALPELRRINQLWPSNEDGLEYTANYKGDPDWTTTAATNFWKGFAQGAESLWNAIKNRI